MSIEELRADVSRLKSKLTAVEVAAPESAPIAQPEHILLATRTATTESVTEVPLEEETGDDSVNTIDENVSDFNEEESLNSSVLTTRLPQPRH